MRRTLLPCLAALGFLAPLLASTPALAQLIIKQPENHPFAELEPHANFGVVHRHYGSFKGKGFGDPDVGAGFRATLLVADPGFIPKLNNSVGITFGLDLMSCRYGCTDDFSIWSPVGLNWSFYLTKDWSVFADGGFLVRSDSFYRHAYGDFFGMVGGRYHFADKKALTIRLGYPFVSVGVSFYAGD